MSDDTDDTDDETTTIRFDNLQGAFDAGQVVGGLRNALIARVMTVKSDDETISIPVGLVDGEHGDQIVVLKDVINTLDSRAIGPRRREGNAVLTEEASFIEHLKRWGSSQTIVYADTKALGFVAVLDDHPEGSDVTSTAWRKHRATYACPRSAEWKIWTDKDGEAMRQTEFADFIETRLEDIRKGRRPDEDGNEVVIADSPAPLDLLTLARNLHIRTKGEFTREINPNTGDHILINKSQTETGSTQIPRAFYIAIPVFEGGNIYQLEARVRFKLTEAGPAFLYTLHRRAEVERDAFGEVRARIGAETGYQMLAGLPG